MRFKISVLLLFVFSCACGQGTSSIGFSWQFRESKVVLSNGDVLNGLLILECNKNIIHVKAVNDSVYTFPAKSVQSFTATGEDRGLLNETYIVQKREFFTHFLKLKGRHQDPAWVFLEQLNKGPVVLFRYVQQNTEDDLFVNSDGLLKYNSNSYLKLNIVYYIKGLNNDLVLLGKPKDILSYYPGQSKNIRNYIKENDLSYNDALDLSFIVNYANSLKYEK